MATSFRGRSRTQILCSVLSAVLQGGKQSKAQGGCCQVFEDVCMFVCLRKSLPGQLFTLWLIFLFLVQRKQKWKLTLKRGKIKHIQNYKEIQAKDPHHLKKRWCTTLCTGPVSSQGSHLLFKSMCAWVGWFTHLPCTPTHALPSRNHLTFSYSFKLLIGVVHFY